jgi:hypothetical protein
MQQVTVVTEMKFCIKCNQDIPKSNFNKNINGTDGLQTYCKPCARKIDIRSVEAQDRRDERLSVEFVEGEEWKGLEGYSKYEFSNHGRVRSLFSKEILKGMKIDNGQYKVTLKNDQGVKKQKSVHELIGKAFVPNPENKKYVKHIDNDGSNNQIENLEWTNQRKRVDKKLVDDVIDEEPQIVEEDISKVIYQVDENNKIIKEWSKIADAGREPGLNAKRISDALRSDKKKFHGGYYWFYKKDYDATKTKLFKKEIKEKKVVEVVFTGNETKHCPKCDKDVLRSGFGKNKNYKDGLQIYCKSCANSYKTDKNQKKRDARLEASTVEGEEWVIVPGYSRYEISKFGRVRNLTSKEVMSMKLDKNRYYRVGLVNDKNEKKNPYIHRLIALAFIPNPEEKETIDHIDRNRANNKLDNLRWANRQEQRENQGARKVKYLITTDDLTNLENEIWKKIEGYEAYEVSNLGRVKHLRKYGDKAMKYVIRYGTNEIINDYIDCTLDGDNGKISYEKMHRLVAKAFIPNPNNYDIVNHKNGIKNDNRADNLEWVTQSENCMHAIETGLSNAEKPIYQIDGNNKIINEWPSATKAASELKLNRSYISHAACSENNKFYSEYFWYFKDDYDASKTKLFKSMRIKPVTQLDLEGNVIKIHDGIKEAGEEIARNLALYVPRTCSTQISR